MTKVKMPRIPLLHKFSVAMLALLKLGLWGVAALALIDSGLFPIPVSMDGVVIGYVATHHHHFFLCCLVAAAASSLGSLVPFFIGRAGGELFLLKRINRQRYESIRDRFERQEFVAIMLPAACPPPFPLKLFEFAAGVFEMKPMPFLLAIFCGKMIQFVAVALLYIWFGPALLHTLHGMFHRHLSIMIGVGSGALLALLLYITRRIFDGRKGLPLPADEAKPLPLEKP